MNRALPADLMISGRVATLAGDDGFGWQAGVAIRDGRVVGIGGESELEALVGAGTQRWRLPDHQVVMPGITDAHLHLMALILAESQIDITGLNLAATLDAVAREHHRRADNRDADGWLLGHGWSAHDLGGWPDADALERVAPGRPVALYAHDHHARWVNRTALRAAGIDGPRGDAAGELVRRAADGQPSGILHEGASALVDPAIPDANEATLVAGLRSVAAKLATLGITGCHDPGELNDDREMKRGPLFYRRMAERDELPLRVHGSVRAPQLARALELGLRSGASVGRFRVGWLKLFSDGSLGSRSAAMLEPYSDAATNPPTGGPRGMVVTDAAALADLISTARGGGIEAQVHAIGDGAVRLVLDVYERLPRADLPLLPRIEHAQLVDAADQSRFGRLAIAASVQPVHLRSDAAQVREAWAGREANAFPLRSLLAGGALLPFGTDAPVEPADPWPGIAVAVCRRDPFDSAAELLGAGEAIPLWRAVRGACLDPQLVAGVADVGRLTPGQRADLIVVPGAGFGEPFDPAVLAATRPLATLIDGRLAHAVPSFDPG